MCKAYLRQACALAACIRNLHAQKKSFNSIALHSEQPKLQRNLAVMSSVGLMRLLGGLTDWFKPLLVAFIYIYSSN